MKKKVLFYNDDLRIGGVERVLLEIFQNINKEKYQIDLLLENSEPENILLLNEVPLNINVEYLVEKETSLKKLKYREEKKTFFGKLLYNFYLNRERKEKKQNIEKKINQKNYDIVIDFNTRLSKRIDKVKAEKKLVWIHASIEKQIKDEDKKLLGERLKNYDKIITICEDMKKETEELYPFLTSKLDVIYNPFNFERIKEKYEDTKELNEEQKKMLKERYAVSVVRLDTNQKDFYTLLKAFEILKKNNVDINLYIVGEGDGRIQIVKWIEEMKLQENVFLLGAFQNPYIWIKNAELFILSSNFEGFGLVLVEAMTCNIPVISSNCPIGPREILEDGKSGILIPIKDYKKMAEEIKSILKDSERRQEIIINAQCRIKEFDKKLIIRKIENLFE